MVLVDTSVWIDHLRSGDAVLADLLEEARVLGHPFVVGELACGNLKNRREILRHLGELPEAPLATHLEVMTFIERHGLMGRGVGYVDVHLLASTALADATRLWSRDRRLDGLATALELAFPDDRQAGIPGTAR